jgi:hypothetical protein
MGRTVLIIGASIASATESSTSSQFEAGMYILILLSIQHPGLHFSKIILRLAGSWIFSPLVSSVEKIDIVC